MRIMLIVILVGILAITGYGVYFIRTVPHDPAVWHVDPRTVPQSPTPNSFRAAPSVITDQPIDMELPTYAVPAASLAEAFDTFVMEQPRVERVAGSVEAGWITYVQRSETLAFPDYITVQFYDLADTQTSTLAIYSRSRFGHSDMGVNKARVEAWLASIESFEGTE
ncbi:DUF1499 domain-containing protein [Algicella marina]|uniref:DUF1499 domain-containing protein n=1 Tax=Algicella marina TaxID=2683284 RepID=A0A6P1SZG9_9RHOB|nr:DUF1499 domain-containing protein [Algicella marina]QHQ34925.1 DUF1499 domain-containing protein [Algicella marina]